MEGKNATLLESFTKPDEKTLELKNEIRLKSTMYNAAMKEMATKIEILREDFKLKNKYNPIEHIKSRLKTPESIIAKANKKGLALNMEDITREIRDIAGVRIVCSFTHDIYTIAEVLQKNIDMEVIEIKDYVQNPKPSGYTSYHMIVKIPVSLTTGKEIVSVEIQIRTIAMDFWASLEHKIKYKYSCDIPESVKEDLRECSEKIKCLDHKMLSLYKVVTED